MRNDLLDSPRKIILKIFQCPNCCCWNGCRKKHNSLVLDIKSDLRCGKKNLNTLHDYLNDRNCFSLCGLKIKIPLIYTESNYNSNCAHSIVHTLIPSYYTSNSCILTLFLEEIEMNRSQRKWNMNGKSRSLPNPVKLQNWLKQLSRMVSWVQTLELGVFYLCYQAVQGSSLIFICLRQKTWW